MGRIIGIDLGTTNSLVAVWENGQSILVPNEYNEYLTPSVVNVDEDGTVHVGKLAKERLVTQPERTASVFKRFMGTDRKIKLGKKEYTPEELSALVLRKLKEDAEAYLGEPVEEAVISVPAYFADRARKATKNAGALAGLRVDRIVNEPSAAALAYKNKEQLDEGTLLVFDFGGGTLDVSAVDIFDNVVEILSVAGDNQLGGSDFDRAIFTHFCKVNGIKYDKLKAKDMGKILEAAETAKQELTLREKTLMQVRLDEKAYELSLSREELIDISKELFSRILIPVRKAINGIKINTGISGVVLVGGSSKMPIIQMYLRHILKKTELKVYEPDFMIAYGVGVYAGIMERQGEVKDYLLTDVCPFSLGVDVLNHNDPSKSIFSPIIERNSALPISKEHDYVTVHDDQRMMEIKIYQGDAYYADDNTELGRMVVSLPPAPAGEERVNVRFSYDINGILMVDVYVPSTGYKDSLLLTGDGSMSEAELKERIAALEKLKIHPRDQEVNKLVMERISRLFEECDGMDKQELSNRAAYFEFILSTQDEVLVKKARKITEQFLDYLEERYGITDTSQEQFDDFKEWYRNGMDSEEADELDEEEDLFLNWYDGHFTS